MSAQALYSSLLPPLSPMSQVICASPSGSPGYETDNAIPSPPGRRSPSSLDELVSTTSTSELSSLIEAELFADAAQKVTGETDQLMNDEQVQQLADSQTESALMQRLPPEAKQRMEQLELEIDYCREAEKSGVKVRSV